MTQIITRNGDNPNITQNGKINKNKFLSGFWDVCHTVNNKKVIGYIKSSFTYYKICNIKEVKI